MPAIRQMYIRIIAGSFPSLTRFVPKTLDVPEKIRGNFLGSIVCQRAGFTSKDPGSYRSQNGKDGRICCVLTQHSASRRKRAIKKVFISSPYRGDVEHNKAFAADMARKAVLEGAIAIVPHLYFTQFLDDDKPEEQELGICM